MYAAGTTSLGKAEVGFELSGGVVREGSGRFGRWLFIGEIIGSVRKALPPYATSPFILIMDLATQDPPDQPRTKVRLVFQPQHLGLSP